LTVLTLVSDITWFLGDNLARQSRDHCPKNCHKSQKHVLFRILQENFPKPEFLQLLNTVWQSET